MIYADSQNRNVVNGPLPCGFAAGCELWKASVQIACSFRSKLRRTRQSSAEIPGRVGISASLSKADIWECFFEVPFVPILLQKSQMAQRLIFRQRTKQATIANQ
jgi:hypothetical protein